MDTPLITAEGQRLAEFSDSVRTSTLKRLEAVPLGKENWRPRDSALSFGEVADHLWEADHWLFRKLQEPELAPMTARCGDIEALDQSGFRALVDKLRASGRERSVLLRQLSDDQLRERIHDQRFNGNVEIWWLIVRGNLDHEIHHRGQIAVYLHLLRN